MKPVFIEARDLPDAWYQAINLVQDEGHIYTVAKGSYEGQKRWEFDYVTVHIKFPGQRPLVPDMPPGMAIPPPTTIEAVEKYMPYLMTNNRQEGETYTYGERLVGRKPLPGNKGIITVKDDIDSDRVEDILKQVNAWATDPDKSLLVLQGATYDPFPTFLEVDQIQTIINTFKEVGEGWNQGTMEIARPTDCGTDDPPCLRLIDCRLRYGALHFVVYFRSWDLWGGFPANLASLQLLKEYMAAEIGCDDGEMIAASKGLHLYDYSWDLAKMRTYRTKADS